MLLLFVCLLCVAHIMYMVYVCRIYLWQSQFLICTSTHFLSCALCFVRFQELLSSSLIEFRGVFNSLYVLYLQVMEPCRFKHLCKEILRYWYQVIQLIVPGLLRNVCIVVA